MAAAFPGAPGAAVKARYLSPALGACSLMPKFLHYRGLELVVEVMRPRHVKEKEDFTPLDSIKTVLDSSGSWPILARRKSDGLLVWIAIFAEDGAEVLKLPKWRDMLSQVESRALSAGKAAEPGNISDVKPALAEVILIAPRDVVAGKQNIRDALEAARAERAKDKSLAPLRLQLFSFDPFSCVVPEQLLVPKHERATAEEVEAYLRLLTAQNKKSDLPVISASDPGVVWAGIFSGEVVRIWRRSPITGSLTPVYRLVR